MAIVPNLAYQTQFVDLKYCTHSRRNAGEPNGVLTPTFVGEMVLDITGDILWKAIDIDVLGWVALTAPN